MIDLPSLMEIVIKIYKENKHKAVVMAENNYKRIIPTSLRKKIRGKRVFQITILPPYQIFLFNLLKNLKDQEENELRPNQTNL